MKKEQKEDECFPFDSVEDITPIINLELNEEEEIDEKEKEKEKTSKELLNMRFKTKHYYLDINGKKRKVKKGRKYKPDDIRKKIKVKLHKTLKLIMNDNLKKAGSQKFFKYLPQMFIGNISHKFNYKYLEYTYKELLLTDFTLYPKEYKNKKIDYNNYLKNKDTVEYLEHNLDISVNSGFSLIKNMKYKDILKAYFSSKQFEYSLLELKNKKESFNYIIDYINLSKNYLDYFCKKNKSQDKDQLTDYLGNILPEEFELFNGSFGYQQ